ncbi:MAG: GTP-binding protein [Thermoleophilia bacterium]|nr:GTP-binding protein [Thermoleophilia bacterium]
MGRETDVYLISGFLGSGKTTFLNRLVKVVPEEARFLILMNEFGEVGLDGTLVEGEDLDMLEISKGSIFCACVKTDFIKALHEIAHTVKPDVMLIETTGVANPSDLDRDLKLPIFAGAFQLRDRFCLIDAANFLDTYQSFLAIEKQLAASDTFIINKIDLCDPGEIGRIKEVVGEFHPAPRFYEAVFAEVPFADLFHQGRLEGSLSPAPCGPGRAASGDGGPTRLSEEELEAYIDGLLNDNAAQVTPPDRLQSLVVEWAPGAQSAFRAWVDALPDRLVRAKGLVELDGALRLLNLVNGKWTLDPYLGPAPADGVRDRVVLISHPEDIRAVQEDDRRA